ncbi:MAG: thiamine phosphate synthase [Syntrophales bacterium]|nr:thiamine phosphate synthase [Syntrophales bacterium]
MRGVYLVTDRDLCFGRSLEDVVLKAVRGGVSCVQLREKTLSTKEFLSEAIAVKELLGNFPVPLIINDRVDVALACGADGVHIGRDDMPYAAARGLMGPRAIIGVSVETWDDVMFFQDLDVSYIAASPVFATPTKTDTGKPWGLEGLRAIKSFSRHPIVAIGGINESNARKVLEAGADSLAVVSWICSADNPEMAARQLKNIIEG